MEQLPGDNIDPDNKKSYVNREQCGQYDHLAGRLLRLLLFQIKKTNNEVHDMKKVPPKDKKIYHNTYFAKIARKPQTY